MSKNKKTRCAWKLTLPREGKSKKSSSRIGCFEVPFEVRRYEKNLPNIDQKKKPPRLQVKYSENSSFGTWKGVPVIEINKRESPMSEACLRSLLERLRVIGSKTEHRKVIVVIPKSHRAKWIKQLRKKRFVIEKLKRWEREGHTEGVSYTSVFTLRLAS